MNDFLNKQTEMAIRAAVHQRIDEAAYRIAWNDYIEQQQAVTVEIEHDARILEHFSWFVPADKQGYIASICGVPKIAGTTLKIEVRWPTIFIRVSGPRHIMAEHFDLAPELEVA